MKTSLIYLALWVGQMLTLHEKKVVHLQPHQNIIPADFGGDLLELINAPSEVDLLATPTKLDSQGNPWAVDIKNLGPGAVTVTGKTHFSVQINVGQTIHIYSNGTEYSLRR